MSDASSNRAVRKALLQAHAEIERIEVAQRVAHVREAVSPRAILHNLLPFGGGGSQGSGQGWNANVQHLASQVGNLYQRYPMIWSTVASMFLGRGRVGRVVKVLGLVLAARQAMQVGRSGRKR